MAKPIQHQLDVPNEWRRNQNSEVKKLDVDSET